ncbi:MAG: GGDEF domain-containing protein [Candidatus Peregrinibacteria bacterium]|nr:GGDEF domain-containing protein [Candidatus Peregrinibacteria bacterium]
MATVEDPKDPVSPSVDALIDQSLAVSGNGHTQRGRPMTPPSAAESLLAITSTDKALTVHPSLEGALDHVKGAMGHFNNLETADKETIAAVEDLCAAINLLVRMVGQMGEESGKKIEILTERLTNELLSKTALKVAAYRDRLTGLGNQASLLEFGPKLFEKAKESGRPLSCLMLDIDFFKSVNDTHGHPVGDQVLTQLSLRLREALRTSDFLMRIGEDEDGGKDDKQGELFDMMARAGGEEFCLLLAGTPLDGACIAAERVRDAVESKPFVVTDKYGEQIKLNISVSIGVAEADFGKVHSAEQLRSQSDRALYMAKEGGRNAVAKIEVGADGSQVFRVITPDTRYKPQGQKRI